jgi:diacylglycerol kinase family enzyme
VLREQRLELLEADRRPVLDPRLREVVRDEMEAAIHTARDDRRFAPWVHGPNGPFSARASLIPVKTFLIVNPRSGSASPSAEELTAAAEERGVTVHVLAEGDDLQQLAREAKADVLGMAGGDGSLGAVAEVALEQDVPLLVVPFGTRNHFARDLGLDRDDPLAALEALGGAERRVDVGRVGDRIFLNNVSLGLYALLVHRRERHRRRGAALARLRAIALVLREHRGKEPFAIDGTLTAARVVLVACNAYSLDLLSIGERERLDEGLLHVYVPHGFRRLTWEERGCTSLTVGTPRRSFRAAIDGEPARLESPVEFRVEPRALRVLVPRAPD